MEVRIVPENVTVMHRIDPRREGPGPAARLAVLRGRRDAAYGNRAEIQHGNGYVTTHSHMAALGRGIVDGARIRQGDVVGYLEQTGLATGLHLHYEVVVNDKATRRPSLSIASTALAGV